ncbi:DUF3541 domain-containing protein [Gallaecimonas sp. GXIMD4217]|uniref:DUF3541 domain-containing protein n=1 Tax=Gallaecimonas sp. GXIMD4217 TaxID=3131927 RepID=UPI00311AE49F
MRRLLLAALLLALLQPALAEQGQAIREKLEAQLFQLPPRTQGHYGIRLYRMTGDPRYLNAALYDLYVVADRLEAIGHGLIRPGYVRGYSQQLVKALPRTQRGRLRKAAIQGREEYLFYADELLRYLSRLDALGFEHPAEPYFRNLLRGYDFEKTLTDPKMIRAWAAQLANHAWWLKQLGLKDHRQAFIDAFRATYPDDRDGKLSEQQLNNKIYGLTHMVFAASRYYQQPVSSKEFGWVADYLADNIDAILARAKPDVIAEVGIVFLLLGKERHPVVAKTRAAILAAVDPEQQLILSQRGSADLALGEHRNVLAWMLLNWPDTLHPGPRLAAHKKIRDDLPRSVSAK